MIAAQPLRTASARAVLCNDAGQLDVNPVFDGWGSLDEFVDGIVHDVARALSVSIRPAEVRDLALEAAQSMQQDLEARGDGKALLALQQFLGQ